MKKSILMLLIILGFNSLIAQVNTPGSPDLSPSGVPSASPGTQDPTLNLQPPAPIVEPIPQPIIIPDQNATPQTQPVAPGVQPPINNNGPNSLPYSNPNGSATSPPKE